MKVFVEGVGVLGSGLGGWQASRPILASLTPYLAAPLLIPPNDLLPSAERRRTGLPVKIALAVGCEAIANAQRNAPDLATVFASSAGDGENMHAICETLANNGHEVSPTRFHNSVHNAPSGYWSIATKSMASSTSLACYDASFAAGLIEAITQTLASGNSVALISYDTPYPQPLHAARPISATFGVGLVLSGSKTQHSLAELEISIKLRSAVSTPVTDVQLEAMRVGTPAARSLPLLAALAALAAQSAQSDQSAQVADRIYLDYVAANQLEVIVHPC